jgi:DNA polymerase elongation subunit (family B)
MMYETDLVKAKRKSMGIVLKRRDNAPIVKDIYGGVIDLFMGGKTSKDAVAFLRNEIDNMHRYETEKFVITKSLRSDYKNPAQIAHKVLAERIGVRDPGNRPRAGDRISFIYVVTAKRKDKKKMLQGEKIETPEYAKSQGLKLDYDHYLKNQIMKPVLQLLALDLEQLPRFDAAKFERELAAWKRKLADPEKYEKKVEQLRLKEVEALVF